MVGDGNAECWHSAGRRRPTTPEQSYERAASAVFRYDALVDGERFQARLDTDEFGRVLLYEGLSEAEVGSPDGERT